MLILRAPRAAAAAPRGLLNAGRMAAAEDAVPGWSDEEREEKRVGRIAGDRTVKFKSELKRVRFEI